MKGQNRPLENDADKVEDDAGQGDVMDVNEDEELEQWSSEEIEVKINISELLT